MVEVRGRGRPREFDIEGALDRALGVFWSHGYAHTSLEDLLKAMKVGRSSFYQAFGSKRELYLRTIDRFLEMVPKSPVGRVRGGRGRVLHGDPKGLRRP